MPGRSISAPISAPLSTSTSVSAQLSPQLLTPLVALHPYWTRLCDGLNELDGVPREMEARTAELETVRGALVSQREKLAAVEAER
jgi:hypothetical protein